jgi:hypothetical protein
MKKRFCGMFAQSSVMNGHAVAKATIPLTKSRRRIACPKAQEHAKSVAHYSRDLRPAKWGSGVSLRGSNPEPLMSALGQEQTFSGQAPMSALPPKADIRSRDQDVCFGPQPDSCIAAKKHHYSITSSASCCRCNGTSRPSALAVLRLISSSNLLGRSMGSSLGFAPERIRLMQLAACLNIDARFGP